MRFPVIARKFPVRLKKFPVFSLFNREIAAPAPETGSPQTACTASFSRVPWPQTVVGVPTIVPGHDQFLMAAGYPVLRLVILATAPNPPSRRTNWPRPVNALPGLTAYAVRCWHGARDHATHPSGLRCFLITTLSASLCIMLLSASSTASIGRSPESRRSAMNRGLASNLSAFRMVSGR